MISKKISWPAKFPEGAFHFHRGERSRDLCDLCGITNKFLGVGFMYSTTDFRKGLKVEIGGEPFVIVDFQHVKPGKGGAFVRTRLKSLVSGNVIDQTFRSGDRGDNPDVV